MDTVDIINVLNRLEKDCGAARYKDGGLEYIRRLALKVLNTVDDEREQVLKFFFDEIEFNLNGYRSVALETLIEMKALALAPSLEEIYNRCYLVRDEHWCYSLIMAMLKLKYHAADSLYYRFIVGYIDKKPDHSFFILVLYCKVEPDRGLPLLANICLFYLRGGDPEMEDLLRSRMIFLFAHILEESVFSLLDVILQTASIDKDIASKLRQILLEELKNHRDIDNNQRLQKEKEEIESLELAI